MPFILQLLRRSETSAHTIISVHGSSQLKVLNNAVDATLCMCSSDSIIPLPTRRDKEPTHINQTMPLLHKIAQSDKAMIKYWLITAVSQSEVISVVI